MKMKVVVTLEHEGKSYTLHPDFDYDEFDQADFVWTDGNFACDCNRSIFINEINDSFPLLECGDTIKLTELKPRPIE
jgi:hypothetical protein